MSKRKIPQVTGFADNFKKNTPMIYSGCQIRP